MSLPREFDKYLAKRIFLKGPKLELFGSRFFTQIRSVWVGLGSDGLGLKIAILYFLSAVADIAKKC